MSFPGKQFLSELFQDQDGGASMKRFIFFLFAVVFCLVTGGVYFHTMDAHSLGFLQTILGYIKEMITWLGTMILGEKIPNAVNAFKGNGNAKPL